VHYHFIIQFSSGYLLYELGLGAFLVERSFFPENERNDQERSHRSGKKRTLIERVLKNFGTVSKRTERNGNCLKRTVKIVYAFLFSRTRSKLGTHFKSGMCFQSWELLNGGYRD